MSLTKDVNNSLLKSSISISENYKNNLDASAKRLLPDEVESRISETGVQELPIDSIKGMMMIDEIPVYHTCHPKQSKDQ